MTPEGIVKKMIKDRLERAGISSKPGRVTDGWYYMPVSLGMGTHGVPDFIGVFKGQFFGIEAKGPKGKTTKLQELIHQQIIKAGGNIYIISCEEEMDACIQELQGVR